MKHLQGFILLLALIGWLLPVPIQADEKPMFIVYPSSEPAWVVEPDLETAEKLYQEWLKPKPRIAKQLTKPTSYNACSCVSYARWRSGMNVGPIGVARNHPVNTHTPSIGALAVTYESGAGHLSYIVDMDDKFIYVDEANYSRCKVTYRRAIPINSKLIKGFYK